MPTQNSVIPGRREAANPESRNTGLWKIPGSTSGRPERYHGQLWPAVGRISEA
jgi:hypothetical protein